MEYAVIIGLLGWCLALIQFVINFRENKRKNDELLLEKTLKYFQSGDVSCSMGISLVEAIWFKRKIYLEVIVPILISKIQYLLLYSESNAIDNRNIIRLFYLIEKSLPYSIDPINENIEISHVLIDAANNPNLEIIGKGTLKHWFSRFNNGDTELFEVETSV